MRGTAVVVLSTLVLASSLGGCLGNDEAPAGRSDRATQPPAVDLGPIRTITGCPDSCFEPTIASGSNGTLYVTHHGEEEAPIFVSEDRGQTWEPVAKPPVPPRGHPTAFSGDKLVSVSPSGDLWYTALIWERPPNNAAYHMIGIQVAVSSDQGASWEVNRLLAPTDAPAWGADRQWVVFGPGGTAYLTTKATVYTVVPFVGNPGSFGPTDLMVTRSEDGGQTWSDWARATETGPAGSGAAENMIPGHPAVLDEDRLVIPYLSGGLHVASSKDGGRSWEQTTVWAPEEGIAGDYFPIAAADQEGRVHIAWRGPGQRIHLISSTDLGATWNEPFVTQPEGNTSAVSPWLHLGETGIALEWFEVPSDDTLLLRHSQGGTLADLRPDQGSAVVTTTTPREYFPQAGTEFPHLAGLPDGTLATLWNDPGAGELRMRLLEPASRAG